MWNLLLKDSTFTSMTITIEKGIDHLSLHNDWGKKADGLVSNISFNFGLPGLAQLLPGMPFYWLPCISISIRVQYQITPSALASQFMNAWIRMQLPSRFIANQKFNLDHRPAGTQPNSGATIQYSNHVHSAPAQPIKTHFMYMKANQPIWSVAFVWMANRSADRNP